MTRPTRNFHALFCALATTLGLVLITMGLVLSSVLVPFTWMRIDHKFVLALGMLVTLLGLASWKLPTSFSMMLASSVGTLTVVFVLGYRPIEAGDVSMMLGAKPRVWQSDHEWTELIVRNDDRYGWSNSPNASGRQVNSDFSVSYNLDSEGWRRLPVASPGAGHDEVWFLGCSFTFGVGVEDQLTYPYLLAAQAWPRIQVRNFSVSGWGTTQAFLALENELKHRPAPRLVVYGLIAHHRQRNYLRKSWFAKGKAGWLPHVELENGQLRWKSLLVNSQADWEDGPELDETEYRVTEALIRGMTRLSREHGVPFVLLLLDDVEARMLDPIRNEPGLHVVDVGHLSSSFFPNEGHPTAVWHQTVAHAIAANPLLAELARSPALFAPNAIPDPPMRAWQESWNRQDGGSMRAIIGYPAKAGAPLHIDVLGTPSGDPWKAVVQRSDFAVTKGQMYSLELSARSVGTRTLRVALSTRQPPWAILGLDESFDLTPEWQSFRRVFIATDNDPAAKLMLLLGDSNEAIEIADEPKFEQLSQRQAAEALIRLAKPGWKLAVTAPAKATLSHASADVHPPMRIRPKSSIDGDIWAIQLQHDGLRIVAGQEYIFELVVRAPQLRPLEYALTLNRSDWDNLGLWGKVDINAEWQTLTRKFLATRSDSGARLTLALGASDQPVEIAKVVLRQGEHALLQDQ